MYLERNIVTIALWGNSTSVTLRGRSKKTSPKKMAIFGPPVSPMSPVNSDKLSLRIQVTKTIWGYFKNSNDTRNYDKSVKFLK